MIYDSARDRVMLISLYSGTCWEWDSAGGWQQTVWTNAPPARSGCAMAYDDSRQRLVIFSGAARSSSLTLDETWEFDGTRWTQRFPVTRPMGRSGGVMEYDPGLGGCVLLGGFPVGQRSYNDSWLWDGQDWRQLNLGAYPSSSRYYPIDADYDVSRQRIIERTLGNGILAYELIDETLRSPQPYPRPGQTLQLDLQMPGEPLRPFVLALSDVDRPGIPLSYVPGLGVERVPLGPSPTLTASLSVGMVGALDGGGRASYRIPVPNDPSLLWRQLYAAGVVASNGWVPRITNGLDMRIVR